MEPHNFVSWIMTYFGLGAPPRSSLSSAFQTAKEARDAFGQPAGQAFARKAQNEMVGQNSNILDTLCFWNHAEMYLKTKTCCMLSSIL